MTLNYPGDSDPREHGDAPTVVAPDDGVPPALAARLESIEASLTYLCQFAESVQTALQRLEGHPMLGKLFGGQTGGDSNGHGG